MLSDNKATIQFAKNSKFHRKAKHLKSYYHFVRNAIKITKAIIKYISTNKMIADPLPKPIPRDAFKAHVLSLELLRV